MAQKNILRMPYVGRQEIARKQVHRVIALAAGNGFYPQKVFDVSIFIPAQIASSTVKKTDFLLHLHTQGVGRLEIRIQVEMFDLLFNDPIGHRVYIETGDVTPKPICLYEWRSTAHERIGNLDTFQMIGPIKAFAEWRLAKLGKQQTPEQCSGSARKPLMYRYNGSVVLLNLLFAQRKIGDKGNVEILFDHAWEPFITFDDFSDGGEP